MLEKIPFETLKHGRFLMFELESQVLGFPYAAIKKLNWTKKEKQPTPHERLEFTLDEGEVQIDGVGLKRLLPLIQGDELFIVRRGEITGEKTLKITEISYEPNEVG